MSCTCAEGPNCKSPIHGLINEACDEYMESLREAWSPHPQEDKLWQSFYGERVPVNQSVIDAWRIYYDDMESLDRIYPHGPARRGSRSVIPQRSGQWPPRYYASRKNIKDLLHRMLGAQERTPTSKGYSEQDMAMHEHERAMTICECRECKQYR